MSTTKSRSSQSAATLVLEKPDAALIAINHKLKQTPVCDKISSALKQITQQSVSSNELQQQRPSRRTPTVLKPPNGCSSSNTPIMSNEDIEKLMKKIAILEKLLQESTMP